MSAPREKIAIVAERAADALARAGTLPTLRWLVRTLVRADVLERAARPAGMPALPKDGEAIDPAPVRAFFDECGIDLEAARRAIAKANDDALVKTAAEIARLDEAAAAARAEAGRARRMLGLFDHAGEQVHVGTMCAASASAIGSLEGADLSLSSGVVVDRRAGCAMLAPASFVRHVPHLASAAVIEGSATEIWHGTADDTKDGSLDRALCIVVETAQANDPAAIMLSYRFLGGPVDVSRVEVVTQCVTPVSCEVSLGVGGGMARWSGASGRGTIVVLGPRTQADAVSIVLRMNDPDKAVQAGASVGYLRSFIVNEVVIADAACVASGSVTSRPIAVPDGVVEPLIVDLDADVPDGAAIETYVARDVDGAVDDSAFAWREAKDVSALLAASATTVSIRSVDVAPIVELSVGDIEAAVCSLGQIDGQIVDAHAGYGQIEVQKAATGLPAAEVPWQRLPASLVPAGTVLCSGADAYRIVATVWADAETACWMPIQHIANATYLMNGTDVTARIARGAASFMLRYGKNTFEVLIDAASQAEQVQLAVPAPSAGVLAVKRLAVVDPQALVWTPDAIAIKDGEALASFDPSGTTVRIVSRSAAAPPAGAVRIKAVLRRSPSGDSPRLRAAYLVGKRI